MTFILAKYFHKVQKHNIQCGRHVLIKSIIFHAVKSVQKKENPQKLFKKKKKAVLTLLTSDNTFISSWNLSSDTLLQMSAMRMRLLTTDIWCM